MKALAGQRIVVIGRAGGIAAAVVEAGVSEGAVVIAAGRRVDELARRHAGGAIDVQDVDVTDEASVRALAERLGTVDHVVVTASARARGAVSDLDPAVVLLSLETKVVGPLLVAKHFGPRITAGGSLVLSSGATATRPAPTMAAVAATNGAVDALTRSLAVELAPVRVNAVSPGTIDSGAWDALGGGKADFLAGRAQANPVGRVGSPEDVASAVVFLMASTFVTGVTVGVDGGERWA
jgi:NAD(P)-dependent dehydrogenase (short-subunit alcohol dehydrogenase family)